MKRLKMPRIPTRIPVPDFPSIHRRSPKEESATIKNDVIQPPAADAAQETKPVEQTKEADEKTEHRKVNVPKIPLPSISKPSAPKLHAPKIPLPSISMPGRSKKSPAQEEKIQPEINATAAPIAPAISAATPQKQTGGKAEPKGGLHKKISMPKMPSLHKAKVIPAPKEPVASAVAEQQSKETKAPAAPPKAKGKAKVTMPKFSMPSMSMGKGGATKPAGKQILAISIEGTDIRLLTYYNNAVQTWKSVSFDAHLLKMGQVADPVGLGEAIKNAVAGIATNKCYTICSLPGLRSVSRIISIPNVSKKELDSVIPREVRRTMTVSEDDNYFHWQALPVEAGQARVFVLAVPKEPLTLLLQAFNHAGLRPAAIDLKPLALMRAINQKDAVIANCEGNSMELVIVADDIPVLIRSVFLGEGVVTQDYAVGRVSDELGRTIVTYNEINKERPLDQNTPVYLTGASAAGTPFALNVAALTGRTVQPLEALINCPAEIPIAEYVVNIGLILKVV